MIGGCATNGHVEESLNLFDRMQRKGFNLDGVSFTGTLTDCSHSSLMEQGLKFIDGMQRVHNLSLEWSTMDV